MPSRTICVYYMSFHVFIFPGIRSPFLFKKNGKENKYAVRLFQPTYLYADCMCINIKSSKK